VYDLFGVNMNKPVNLLTCITQVRVLVFTCTRIHTQ